MKLAGALMALASLATIVVVIIAISGTSDDLIGDMRKCVERGGATIVHGPTNLGQARSDIRAKVLTKVRTVTKGGDTIVVLKGTRVRLLVLANDKSPTLSGDLPKRLYEHADEFPLVALEVDPTKGVLNGCAGIAAG